jgi:hypothetical protein
MSLLSWLLVILAGLSLAAMVVSITIASRATREARSTIFPVVREEETVRARRAHIATSITGVIAAIMAGAFFLSGQLPSLNIPTLSVPAEFAAIIESPVVEAESLAVETEAPIAVTETLLPQGEEQTTPASSQMPVSTPQLSSDETPTLLTRPILASPTLIPTLAPAATSSPIPLSATAVASPVLAPGDMELGPITFAAEVTGRRLPINARTVFSDTTRRVYATFPYSGMRNGLTWTQVWYFNDAEFSRGDEVWQWGSADRSYIFTKLVGAGDYRLELYVNDDLVASGEFTVLGPLAVGGPEIPADSGTPEILTTSENQETPESPEGTVTPESP